MKHKNVPFISRRERIAFWVVMVCGVVGGVALGFIFVYVLLSMVLWG